MLIAARFLQALGGSGAIVLARAIVRDLYSGRARRPRIVADGRGDGARAGDGADHRRRGADRVRLALDFRRAGRDRRSPPCSRLAAAAGDVAAARVRTGVVRRQCCGVFGVLARNRVFSPIWRLASSYAGLFAWISGASFVLQDLYGLTPFNFGVAFAVRAVGYMIGHGAGRAASSCASGSTARIGFGAGALAVGGLAMVLALALAPLSVLSLDPADGDLSRRHRHGAAAGARRRAARRFPSAPARRPRCSASSSRAARRMSARWSASCSGSAPGRWR